MQPSSACPVSALRPYVRRFEQRVAELEHGELIYPIAARPDQFLEFYFEERYLIHSHDSGARELAPRSVVVGPSTYRRVDLVLNGRFEVFTIQFQPSGFFQLFGTPMQNLTDRAYEARSVLGASIGEIEDRLANAHNFMRRVDIASDFVGRRVSALKNRFDAVASIADQILINRGALRIPDAAARTGLSVRQFERKFLEHVGVAPRRYARIVRFQAALTAHLNARQTWIDVAHELGYHDQMHMVHDFRLFSGESPTRVSALFTLNPERWA